MAELARPHYERIVAEVQALRLITTDDTILPMQAHGHARPARMLQSFRRR